MATIGPRSRKLLGGILLVALVAAYALLAGLFGALILDGAPKLAETAYYVVAGFLWILPAAWLIRWMQARG